MIPSDICMSWSVEYGNTWKMAERFSTSSLKYGFPALRQLSQPPDYIQDALLAYSSKIKWNLCAETNNLLSLSKRKVVGGHQAIFFTLKYGIHKWIKRSSIFLLNWGKSSYFALNFGLNYVYNINKDALCILDFRCMCSLLHKKLHIEVCLDVDWSNMMYIVLYISLWSSP